MAKLLWKRGTTLGTGGFGIVSLASTSNALFNGIHNNGIIHCDIKPGNILLVGTTAKIADFGLSLTLEQGMNQQGLIRGTERYMAPESVINTEYGPEVDIWALGCTVYELITGTPLWEDADDDDVLYKIEFEEPNFQNSKLSYQAQDFLEKCLVKDPSSCWTAEMLLNHPFLLNSSDVAKTRKKQSGSTSLLHKPLRKIIFKIGHRKFVRELPDPKEVENETCTDNR